MLFSVARIHPSCLCRLSTSHSRFSKLGSALLCRPTGVPAEQRTPSVAFIADGGQQGFRYLYGNSTQLKTLYPALGSSFKLVHATRQQPSTAASSTGLAAGLYLVGTPIGNLEDITFRAVRILREASLVLAEDTRHSGRLLQHLGIKTKLLSFHSYSEAGRLQQALELLAQGHSVALVTDAGMPAISDPGTDLVSAAVKAGHAVVPIPGPSASLAALVVSGLPTHEFSFVGFLPAKSAARRSQLLNLSGVAATLIFFAPARILREVLSDMVHAWGSQRQCAIARELTKMHEEVLRGSLEELVMLCSQRTLQGEVTVVVEGCRAAGDDLASPMAQEGQKQFVRDLMELGIPASTAARLSAKHLKASKRQMYEFASSIRSSSL